MQIDEREVNDDASEIVPSEFALKVMMFDTLAIMEVLIDRAEVFLSNGVDTANAG